MSGFAGPGRSGPVTTEAEIATAGDGRYLRLRSNEGKKNYIINGGMRISQENGATAVTASGSYPVDQFWILNSSAGAFSAQQVASVTPGGSPNRLRVTVTTADAAVAATDYVCLEQVLEGLRIADLRSGSAASKQVVLQFGVKAPAGTYGVSFRGGGGRSYVGEYTISADEANTDVIKSVQLRLDQSGTWATDTSGAMSIAWCLMAGSNFQQAPDSWQTAGAFGSSNQFNFMGTVGNVFELFDVGLYEGEVAPAFQLPDYPAELALCQRYFVGIPTSSVFGHGTLRTAGTSGYGSIQVPVPMRVSPTMLTMSGLQVICGDTLVNVSSLAYPPMNGVNAGASPNLSGAAGSIGQSFIFYQASGKNGLTARM